MTMNPWWDSPMIIYVRWLVGSSDHIISTLFISSQDKQGLLRKDNLIIVNLTGEGTVLLSVCFSPLTKNWRASSGGNNWWLKPGGNVSHSLCWECFVPYRNQHFSWLILCWQFLPQLSPTLLGAKVRLWMVHLKIVLIIWNWFYL